MAYDSLVMHGSVILYANYRLIFGFCYHLYTPFLNFAIASLDVHMCTKWADEFLECMVHILQNADREVLHALPRLSAQ